MASFKSYLPILIVVLVILLLGCWNPRGTQAKDANGNPKGYQSTNWLAFWVLVIGLLACALVMNGRGYDRV